MEDRPEMEPNGRRAISACCFCVLSLQLETQNEVDVLKPILEELEVLRLSCALGALPSANATDFQSELLEAKQFDDDFARFLRSDVFGASSDGSRANGPVVRVLGLFGKQAQVKTQLLRLGGWDDAMETKLRATDVGMYATVLREGEEEQPTVKTVVVFAWLLDESFHTDRLRETPTYLLRLLTCLTPDVVCCLSGEDKQFMEAVALNEDPMGDSEYKSYSAAFHVEQQQDAKDDVQSAVVQVFALPSQLKNATDVTVVKGSFAAVRAIVQAPPTTSNKRTRITHSDNASFCNWLVKQPKQYDLRIVSWDDWSEDLKEAVLRKFNRWPRAKLAGVEARFQQDVWRWEAKCQVTELWLIDQDLAALGAARDEIFQVDALLDAPSGLTPSIELIKGFVGEFKRDVSTSISRESEKVLKLPARLSRLLGICWALYKRGREDELQTMLKKAPYTGLKAIAAQQTRSALFEAVASWLTKTSKMRSFREWIRGPLGILKERWWAEMNHTVTTVSQRRQSRKVNEGRNRFVDIKGIERREVVNDSFKELMALWALSEEHGVCLHISSLQRGGPGQKSLSCVVGRDELSKGGYQIKMWALKNTGASAVDPLLSESGELDLANGEIVRGVFAVQARSILLVTTISDNTVVRRVEFKSHMHCGQPSIRDLRTFSRVVELCEYCNEERLLVLGDAAGKIGVYRLDESCSSMETIRTVDMAVKSSLTQPFGSIALSDGTLHVTDHVGSIQSLNIRNQQTSRKRMIASGPNAKKIRLVHLLNGGVLGWIDAARSATSGRVTMVVVASDDMRELPQSVMVQIPWDGEDCIVYDIVGEFLFLVIAKSGKLYQVKLEASLKSESFRIKSKREVRQKQQVGVASDEGGSEPPMPSLHWLWTFYHLYETFPVLGELFRTARGNLHTPSLAVAFDTPGNDGDRALFCDGCRKVLALIMDKLRLLNKPLFGLDLSGRLNICEPVDENIARLHQIASPQLVTSLLRELVTFVPVQICRAELNTLTLMVNGKPWESGGSDEVEVAPTPLHSSDIAMKLRYGLLSPLLTSWCKKCVVITSMGKQSTGKSYFLNLTGSSFAISGARCTDGAWMSVRVLPSDVLLVVIDFEGLRSFERTEQEDVFLSVLNASVSKLTIFRMEMRLDKEIDELFSKFQKGARLIKRDPRLFRGMLYMSVKDVNPNDSRGVIDEFVTKFQCLLHANKEQNFLSDMYAGQLQINSSPPLGTVGYYQSLSHVQHLVDGLLYRDPAAGFVTGKAFLDCISLLLAKLSILDWTSLDESARRLKFAEAAKKLPGVLRFGSFVDTSSSDFVQPQLARDKLVSASTGDVISASFDEVCAANLLMAVQWRELAALVHMDQVDDDQIDLGPCGTPSATVNKVEAASKTIQVVFAIFIELLARAALRRLTCKSMQQEFDACLSFFVRRRCLRIRKWSCSIFGERIPEAWCVMEQQATGALQTLLVRCLDSCSSCQLGCMKASVHAANGDPVHDCSTNHACDDVCSYCGVVENDRTPPRCSKPAGHEGSCECRYGDHTCGGTCVLQRAINCGKRCTEKSGHEDDVDHRCSVGLHKCGEPCAAHGCSRQCVTDIEVPHTPHKCEIERCLAQCVMSGCNRSCSSSDHFHGQQEDISVTDSEILDLTDLRAAAADTPGSTTSTAHMCDVGHVCPEMCEQSGICHIDVMLKESSKMFVGARSSFQYTFQEMNGSRRKCAFKLEPGQTTHKGKHSCCEVAYDSQDEDGSQSPGFDGAARVRHYCEVRCPACSYCQKAHGHSGLHKTTHGNMRNIMFSVTSRTSI